MELIIFILLGLLIISTGVYYLRVDPIRFFSLMIGLSLFLEFVVNKVTPSFTYYVNPFIMLNILVGVAYAYVFKRHHTYRGLSHDGVMRAFFFTVLFLIVMSVFRGIDFRAYFSDYRRVILGYLLVTMFLILAPTDNRQRLFKFVFVMMAIQVGIGMLQYFGPQGISGFLSERSSYLMGDETITLKEEYFNEAGLIAGTLARFNQYGNTLTLFLVYSCSVYVQERREISGIQPKIFWSLVVLTCVAIGLSGNKVSVISALLGLLLLLWHQRRKVAIFTVLGMMVTIFLYMNVLAELGLSVATIPEGTIRSPIERLAASFSLLGNPFVDDTYSVTTFSISMATLPYFFLNPLF